MHKALLLAVLLCSSCSARETSGTKLDPDPARILHCYEHGSAPGKFCRASMLQVVTWRGLFQNRQVIVPGFVADVEGDFYMFPTKEFYQNRDLSSSVRLLGNLDLLKGKEKTNMVVFGSFSLDAPDPSTLMKPAGAITILSVRGGYNKP